MLLFLPSDDPNEYNDGNGSPPGPGGGETVPAVHALLPSRHGGTPGSGCPGPRPRSWRGDFFVLTVVVIGCLAGKHHIFCGSVSGDSNGGAGGGGLG
jgi:hypothetical protein